MNLPIGLSLVDKFKLLRKREKLSQRGLAAATNLPQSTIANFEAGRTKTINTDVFNSFVEHDELSKYALWLLNDQIDPDRVDAMLEFLDLHEQTDESRRDE